MVAQVEQLVERESLLANGVEPHVNLEPRALLLQRRESGLALLADGHDAPGHDDIFALGLKLLARRLVPLGAHLGQRDRRLVLRGREAVGIRRLAQLRNFLQLFAPLIKELALEFRFELHTSFSRWMVGPTASIAAMLGVLWVIARGCSARV